MLSEAKHLKQLKKKILHFVQNDTFVFFRRLIFLVVTGLVIVAGCGGDVKDAGKTSMPQRDINIVKEANVNELMSLPGVAGVYVGELDDHTPCITVMVVKKTPELEKKIPRSLEGHPVRIEETGEIKPME